MLTDGHGSPMVATNGSPIHTYGARFMELCFGEQQFGWDFVAAKVTSPLLCMDFLCAYGMLVDVKHRHLIDTVTFCSNACTFRGADYSRLYSMLSAMDDYLRLLVEFLSSCSPPSHGVEHHTKRV